MLESPRENTGCWWDPFEKKNEGLCGQLMCYRKRTDCFEAVANQTQFGGMSAGNNSLYRK